jgi:hypothetical protein
MFITNETRFGTFGFCVATTVFRGSCLPHIRTVDPLTSHDSRSTTRLYCPEICRGNLLRSNFASHVDLILLPREGRLQSLKNCHRLFRVLMVGYHGSERFSHARDKGR